MEIKEVSPPQKTKTMANFFQFSKNNPANQIPSPIPSNLPTFPESSFHESIQNSESLIRKWDPNSSSMEKFIYLFQENRKEAMEFLKIVDDLRKAMDFLISQHSGSDKLPVSQMLMKIAMHRLEKEFFQILSANREYLNSESVSSHSSRQSRSLSFGNSDEDDELYVSNEDNNNPMTTSKVETTMADLKMIAECLISSGYSNECLKIYKITRKSILDEELYRLGVKSYSSSKINQLNSAAFEDQIKKWILAAKTAVKTLFRKERILGDHVFDSSEKIRETCIAHITMDGAMKLFKFPETVAKSKRSSPENIFRLMNMYETISDLLPEIEFIFSYEQLSVIRLQALSSLHKLGESVEKILSEYASSIQKNSGKTTIPGGGIHPLTSSVMDYVCLLANNSGTLAEIVASDQENIKMSPFPESYFDSSENPASSVAGKLAWIILVLLCKLDSKAKQYNDIALSYLFLANNLGLVVKKVSNSVLKILLGEEWVLKLQNKVKLYAANYETVAWNKALSCLPPEENRVAGEITPEFIKRCFRQFNLVFEDVYRKQCNWVIPDSKLRDEIKLSIARKLVPAYREFYDSYLAILSKDKNFEVLVRFSPDNLGNYLSDLFHKTAVMGNSSSSSPAQYRLALCIS